MLWQVHEKVRHWNEWGDWIPLRVLTGWNCSCDWGKEWCRYGHWACQWTGVAEFRQCLTLFSRCVPFNTVCNQWLIRLLQYCVWRVFMKSRLHCLRQIRVLSCIYTVSIVCYYLFHNEYRIPFLMCFCIDCVGFLYSSFSSSLLSLLPIDNCPCF